MSDATFADKLASIMPEVAERIGPEFFGPHNKRLSTKREMRFGKKGSLVIDLEKGVYHDKEADEGGGVLKLLEVYKNLSKLEAIKWLEDQGYIEPQQQRRGDEAGSPQGKFAGFMDDWPIATFSYYDDAGRLAYEVLKFAKTAPRRYMQRRRHPEGKGWVWGLQEGTYAQNRAGDWFKEKDSTHKNAPRVTLPDAERWLYRRDEVLKAKAEGVPVILVGGEKDVETLRAWGFVATTNAQGEKYWRDSFDADLAGCDLFICSDNDATGHQRTMRRGASLQGRSKSVRVIDLKVMAWPDMPEKNDVTDWKDDAGGTAAAFTGLMARAPRWKIEPPKSRFKAIEWHHLDDPGPELEFLIDGWCTEGERSVVAGASKSGKTFLALHLAGCVMRGVPFFGYKAKKGGVVYQAGEGGRGIKKRLRAYRKYFQVEGEDVNFVLLPAKVDLYSRDGDVNPLIEEIKAWALTFSEPLRLVVVDTLATASIGANENDGRDMGIVLANIARIAEECDCHVMLVHHMNADGSKLRGHTSIFANVDQVISVTMDEETKVRSAVLTKQKDDDDGLTVKFALQSVPLSHDPKTDRDVTSCVIVSVEEKELLKKEQQKQGWSPTINERRVMLTYFDALSKHGILVGFDDVAKGDERQIPRSAVGKTILRWTDYRDVALSQMPEEEDRKKAGDKVRQQFAGVKTNLMRGGVLEIEGKYMWWTGKPIRGLPETFPSWGRHHASPAESDPGFDAPALTDQQVQDMLDFYQGEEVQL